MPAVALSAIAGAGGYAVGAAASSAITFSWAQAIGYAVLNAALTGASMLLTKKPKGIDTSTLSGISVTGYGSTNPRQIVYGKARVGGTIFFQHSTGTNNEYLHLCISFAGHEIESFEKIYFDEKEVALDGSNATGDYDGFVFINKHLGADDQAADADLITAAPDKWTATERARGTAYLYLRLKWDATIFQNGLPQITALIKGKKVYDARTGTTAWSDNPALCLRDYLTNGRNVQVAKLGLDADDDDIDDTYFNAAANACDELVLLKDGSTEKRYTCNGAVTTDSNPEDIIGQLRMSMAGTVTMIGGKFICYAGVWRTPESTGITEDDVLGNVSIQTSIPRADYFNAVKGTYVGEATNYEAADFPSVDDGSTELVYTDLTLAFTNTASTAQRIAKIELLKGKQPITVSFKAPLSSVKFLIGDNIPVTFSRYGWSGKYFECVNQSLVLETDNSSNPFIAVNLIMRETASTIYDWETDEESQIDDAPNTNLPSAFDVATPTDLVLTSGTSDLFVRADGTVWARIKVSWTAAAWASVQSGGNYELEHKKSSDSQWTPSGYPRGDQTQAYIADVEDGVSYDVRLRAVSFLGAMSDWMTYIGHIVIGKTQPPEAPTAFLVRRLPDGTRKYSWTPPVGVYDLAGYEIRYSTDTSDEWDDMQTLHNGVLTSSPYESNNPTAGTYRFAIKSIDRSGNYSTITRYVTTTLGAARITGVIASYDFRDDDDWSGTLTDCHVNSVNGEIEADGGSSWSSFGTWDSIVTWMDGCISPITYTSDVKDLGSSQTFLPQIEGVVIGTPTYYINTSADNITWDGWTSTFSTVTARYTQSRVVVAGTSPTIKSLVTILNID